MLMRTWSRGVYDFAKLVLRDYSKDNGSIAAAAVSFYVFLSLIPLLLLAVAVLGFVLGSEVSARQAAQQYFEQYWPTATGQASEFKVLLDEVIAHRGAATGLGALLLLLSGVSTVTTLESAINLAWNAREQRSYVMRRLKALAVFLAVVLMLGASFAATTVLGAARESGLRWPWLLNVLGYLLPITVAIGAFTLVYKVLPRAHVPLKSALIGGVFAGVLWEIAKQLFSFYVTHFSHYSKVYGSLGGLILLAVWINYSAVVTVLGAEVGSEAARLDSNNSRSSRSMPGLPSS